MGVDVYIHAFWTFGRHNPTDGRVVVGIVPVSRKFIILPGLQIGMFGRPKVPGHYNDCGIPATIKQLMQLANTVMKLCLISRHVCIRFEDSTAVTMKNAVF
jgi:hypothetical protein